VLSSLITLALINTEVVERVRQHLANNSHQSKMAVQDLMIGPPPPVFTFGVCTPVGRLYRVIGHNALSHNNNNNSITTLLQLDSIQIYLHLNPLSNLHQTGEIYVYVKIILTFFFKNQNKTIKKQQ
jgi:hypothetical protein